MLVNLSFLHFFFVSIVYIVLIPLNFAYAATPMLLSEEMYSSTFIQKVEISNIPKDLSTFDRKWRDSLVAGLAKAQAFTRGRTIRSKTTESRTEEEVWFIRSSLFSSDVAANSIISQSTLPFVESYVDNTTQEKNLLTLSPARLLLYGWLIANKQDLKNFSPVLKIDANVFNKLANEWKSLQPTLANKNTSSEFPFLISIFNSIGGAGVIPFSLQATNATLDCINDSLPLLEKMVELIFLDLNLDVEIEVNFLETKYQEILPKVPECLKYS